MIKLTQVLSIIEREAIAIVCLRMAMYYRLTLELSRAAKRRRLE
jgi:hypothetical protein